MQRRQQTAMTSPTSTIATAMLGLLLVATSACGSLNEPEVPPISEPVGPIAVSDPSSPATLQREVIALNADRSVAVVVDLQIDDLRSLPVGESIDVSPQGAVRAIVLASGTIPARHPACDLVENPLPDEVNPCVDAVTLREVEQPIPLTGVLVLSVNDDVVSGALDAFWGEEDAVHGTF